MDFIPITDTDLKEMLQTIGVDALDDLFRDIPKEIPHVKLNLPGPLSEPELIKLLRDLGKKNKNTSETDNYLGAGSYEHFIPSVVNSLAQRAEFVTAYTPYQAEASQGTLQSIYEYQTLICQLTGMDVSNASLYEGGSALAEAVLVSYRNKNISSGKVLVSKTVHPEYRQVINTYTKSLPIEIIEIPYKDGVTDIDFVKDNICDNTLSIVVQSPNFFGCLEPLWEITPLAKQHNALSILSSYPISLGILKSPSEFGFDIVTGEGQALGNPIMFGGPYLGYFACTKELLRKMPGRIVGRTKDTQGKDGFVLTLQTREQHIRREKATSNICTNQALNALTACIYLCTLGKQGLTELAKLNVYLSHYAKDKICKVSGLNDVFPGPFFNEFVIKGNIDKEELLNNQIIGGFSLEKFYPELKDCSLWCVTETKTKEQIDKLIEVLKCK